MLKKSLFLIAFLAVQTFSWAQSSLWVKSEESRIPAVLMANRQIIPQKYQVFELNFSAMKNILATAPLRFSDDAQSKQVIVEIPFPDGTLQHFRIEEAPTMHPDLQAKYKDIRSFAGYGVENRSASMRCEYSPSGFSAMIFLPESTYFVDPFAKGNTTFYTAYDKKDFKSDKKMDCQVIESLGDQGAVDGEARTGDGKLRTYRLALACTGEYATYHGGTVPKVMAAMNKSITRVNGVYEKEHSITLVMVPKNDTLIFLNASSDPYMNSSGSTMLNQNQTTCDQRIGTANYDFGHVFSTGGGGIANLQSPCKNGAKAKGVTGLTDPINDPFDIDYVCHEMGHQCGGEHTFNNSCGGNISATSAYEVGSGSTIMGYAGVCSPNVQNNSDAYFHQQSLAQINTYMVTGTGNTCAVKTNTNNNSQPVVSAGADYIIPKSTFFELTSAATDADGDPITYCWEQWDKESAPQAPKSTNTVGPAFRSYFPKVSPTRTFPSLDNIVKNTNNTWEVLSSVARGYNFRVTARDLHNGFGRSNSDIMTVTVTAGAGPFLVTAPNTTGIKWDVLTKQTVTWNVANTDAAPISATNVDILLSTDGGYTYPDTIATNVPNTGSYEITVPNKPSTKARIKVKGSGNIFFDISNADFTIYLPPVPLFVIGTNVTSSSICKDNKDSLSVNLSFTSVAGYKELIKIATKNIPTGAKVTLSADTLTPTGNIKVVLYDLKKVTQNGNYNFKVVGTGATRKDSLTIPLSIYNGIPNTALAISPIDNKTVAAKNSFLKWKKANNTDKYTIEISKDYLFGVLEESAIVSDTFYTPTKLVNSTVYFWRIKGKNACVDGSYSATYAFQTTEPVCNVFGNPFSPFSIPNSSVFDQKFDAVVSGTNAVTNVEVQTNITHDFLGDLILTLESPNGKTAKLINAQCSTNDNIDATFSDAGVALVCANLPAIKGIVKPKEAFSVFNGAVSNGIWRLRVQDTDGVSGGGSVNAFTLKVCSVAPVNVTMDWTKSDFKIIEGNYKAVNTQFLNVTSPNVQPQDVTLLITKLPTQGTLRRGSTPLAIGAKVTMQEVNTGALLYFNNVGSTAKDSFQFMAFTNTNGWLTTSTFPIQVLTGSLLTINAAQTKKISCYNDNNAQISIDIIGGTKPYLYSIDGGTTYKDTSMFFNLAAGKYIPTVKDFQGLIKKGDTISILNPALLKLTAVKDSNNIYVKVAGGTKPYLINFNNKGFAKVDSFLQLANGKYPILIKDANNCTTTDTVSIAINSLVASAIVSKTIQCNGAKNGEIKANIKGGKSPYQYQLNNGTFQSSNTFTGIDVGDYTITVKDADGFLRTSSKVTLTNPPLISATLSIVQDSLFVQGTGGTGLLAYSFDGSPFNSKNNFANIDNGKYKLLIRDDNNCLATYDIEIKALYLFIDDFKTISCFGEATGEVKLAVENGKLPYQFSKDNGVTYQSSNVFSNLPAGSYDLTIKDATGFVRTLKYKLTEPTKLTVAAAVSGNTVTLNANGGTPTYTYSQQGGVQNQSSNQFSNLSGNQTFTVKDANGCITTVNVKGVAAADLTEKLGASIAPNPASDFVTIRLQTVAENDMPLEISNLQGQILLKNTFFKNTTQQKINVADLPNGMYQLSLRQGKESAIFKVLILK
jgi:subtilisin-like proprotein convertase family protein